MQSPQLTQRQNVTRVPALSHAKDAELSATSNPPQRQQDAGGGVAGLVLGVRFLSGAR